MSKENDILYKILNDLRVELADEFDKNFERKAFFNEQWEDRKHDSKGSLMLVTGKLRRSIKSEIEGSSIVFSSSEPYAVIHNEGGEITVTEKMKSYFWAKYYEVVGKITHTKKGTFIRSQRNMELSELAQWYKNMALMKVGSKIRIPKRQFIGHHSEVDRCVKQVIDDNMKDVQAYIKNLLKSKHKK